MSVDSKIKELLERVKAQATDAETLSEEGAQPMGSTSVAKDSSIKAANAGDATNPMQGSSQKASIETREEDEPNQGMKASAPVSKNNLTAQPPGAAPNFTTVGDPSMAVNQPNSKGNVNEAAPNVNYDNQMAVGRYIKAKTGHKVYFDGDDMVHDKSGRTVTKNVWEKGHTADELAAHVNKFTKNMKEDVEDDAPSLKEQIVSIFGDDVSEDFANKATSIFEAAVVARVNSEMENIIEQLEEQKATELAEAKEQMVEKIDSFLNYVVEQWMTENEIAIESGLRTEIAEDFIVGMKALFKEHYIEVPEEKFDVIGDLQGKTETLESKLDEAVESNIQLKKELDTLKRASILENASKDLADTEAEKLGKLLEGVDFENEELFAEKVSVIKENYFPKNGSSTQVSSVISEDSESTAETLVEDSVVSRYARALSRTIKKN